MISRVVIFASGFGNRESTDSGMRRRYLEVRPDLADAKTYVMMRTWKRDNWRDLARIVAADTTRNPRIEFIGHSYGAGVGFWKFAELLMREGKRIATAILVDPVPRAIRWGGLASLRHLFHHGWDRLTLPPNVARTIVFRQVNNRPMGRIVQANEPGQQIVSTVYGRSLNDEPRLPWETVVHSSSVIHANIDNHASVMEAILRVLIS